MFLSAGKQLIFKTDGISVEERDESDIIFIRRERTGLSAV